MNTKFLENSAFGKNEYWRYLVVTLAPVAVVILLNILLNQFLPQLKGLFPDDDFGKNIGMFFIIMIIFGGALLAFLTVAVKLHRRKAMTFISTERRFNFKSYLTGFLMWGLLVFFGSLLTDSEGFTNFQQSFNPTRLLLLFLVGFVAIGVQSLFEEIVMRGYFLQGMYRRVRNIPLLIVINALIFGALHFGYGIGSLIHSFSFGVTFALIILLQNRIEFAAGAHNANNLVLSLFFLDLEEAINKSFEWTVDWTETGIHLMNLLILIALVYKFFRK